METVENSIMKNFSGSQTLLKPPLAKVRKSLFKVEEIKNSSKRINFNDQNSTTMTENMNKPKLLSRQAAKKII